MDFNQLRAFIAVVEAGSFSRAGDKLFLSQPTVTTQVKSLETELGQQLLVRSTNGIQATEAGKRILDYAKRTLGEREALLEEFGKFSSGVRHINVAASTIPGQYILPEIIAAFQKLNPQVRIHLTLCNSSQVCQALLERKADIGVGGTDSFQGDCDYQPIVDDPLVVIAPNREPFASMSSEENFPINLLRRTPFVIREEGSGSRREFEKWLHEHTDSYHVNVAAVMNDNQAIKHTVAAGNCISVSSARSVQKDVKQGILKSFPLEGTADRKLYLVRRKKIKLMGEAAEFYNFVQEHVMKNFK